LTEWNSEHSRFISYILWQRY